jgi:hypothetical protein
MVVLRAAIFSETKRILKQGHPMSTLWEALLFYPGAGKRSVLLANSDAVEWASDAKIKAQTLSLRW